MLLPIGPLTRVFQVSSSQPSSEPSEKGCSLPALSHGACAGVLVPLGGRDFWSITPLFWVMTPFFKGHGDSRCPFVRGPQNGAFHVSRPRPSDFAKTSPASRCFVVSRPSPREAPKGALRKKPLASAEPLAKPLAVVVKTLLDPMLLGKFKIFRTYFSRGWDVHRGCGLWILTYGQMKDGGSQHKYLSSLPEFRSGSIYIDLFWEFGSSWWQATV